MKNCHVNQHIIVDFNDVLYVLSHNQHPHYITYHSTNINHTQVLLERHDQFRQIYNSRMEIYSSLLQE